MMMTSRTSVTSDNSFVELHRDQRNTGPADSRSGFSAGRDRDARDDIRGRGRAGGSDDRDVEDTGGRQRLQDNDGRRTAQVARDVSEQHLPPGRHPVETSL